MNVKNTGGPAFPQPILDIGGGSGIVAADEVDWGGMTLRDHFAVQAPTDEVQEIMFRHLSNDAQESITGMVYPSARSVNLTREERVALQIAELEFKCAVNAAIRFKLADAMLREREK